MNKSHDSHSFPYFRIIISSIVFVLLSLAHWNSYSQEIFSKIESHQKKYSQLDQDFGVSISRVHSTIASYHVQSLTADQLMNTSQLLMGVQTQISSIERLLEKLGGYVLIGGLVTEAKSIPIVTRYVNRERAYIIKNINLSIEYIDKVISNATDKETIRLLMHARDTFKSTNVFLDQLPINF